MHLPESVVNAAQVVIFRRPHPVLVQGDQGPVVALGRLHSVTCPLRAPVQCGGRPSQRSHQVHPVRAEEGCVLPPHPVRRPAVLGDAAQMESPLSFVCARLPGPRETADLELV